MELTGKRILVVGLGRSGVGAARFCAERGARVTVTDRRAAAELRQLLEVLPATVTRELGVHHPSTFVAQDLIVVSPGVPELAELVAARQAGVPIVGELELSHRFTRARTVAITGTNGKSTTTALLGAMVAAAGRPTFVGGNLGVPLVEALGTAAAGPDGTVVLEVSSFQLETVETFRAHVALLLNLSEDHLDRYPDFEAYVAAKARVFERQTGADWAVVAGDPGQERCRALVPATGARPIAFRLERGESSEPGAWLDGERLVVQLPGAAAESIPRGECRLAGRHNLQNALAALLAARLLGVDLALCAGALRDFRGLPHRMELVGEVAGVRYFNDSKATNVGSVVGSLTGFEQPVVLIAGGKDKGGDYGPLLPLLRQVARHVVLIGAAAAKMERALAGTVPLHRAADLDAAVSLAASLARAGEAVVLSPACSSYDMFRNFEDRGERFATAVRRLGGES